MQILRLIGRISFPIYAFLLANGFRYTHDRKRYLLRLCGFALVSEIPYDMTFYGSYGLSFQQQNIFFTLAIGLVGLMLKEALEKRTSHSTATLFSFLAASLVAELTGASYGTAGILSIIVFALWLEERISLPMAGLLLYLGYVALFVNWDYLRMYGIALIPQMLQPYAALAVVPIHYYNHQPGPRHPVIQYGFYLFYPLHLLVLYALRLVL